MSWREGAKSGAGGTAPNAGKKKGGGSIKVTAAATRFQERAAVQQKAAGAGEGRGRADVQQGEHGTRDLAALRARSAPRAGGAASPRALQRVAGAGRAGGARDEGTGG